jgi:hypothetical protein
MEKRKPKSETLKKKRAKLIASFANPERILRGSIVERYKKCGKPGCHCNTGKGHGPAYYLSVTLSAGKTRSFYIPVRLRRLVAKYLENHKKNRELFEKIIEINLQLLERRELELEE